MRLGYSCRACSRPLQASEGCSMCKDLKRIIVVTGEEEISPLDAVQRNVRLLDTQLRDYEKAQTSAKDPDTREACREAVRQVASKLAQLADAHRKLAEKRQEAVEAMTLAEQKVLFAEWFRSLTPKHRQEVVAALAASEAEMNLASNAGWRNQLA